MILSAILSRAHWSTPEMYLTHFSPIFHFYTPWKRQKTFDFVTYSGGIGMEHWTKMGEDPVKHLR